jgi:hypothetical protein
MTPTRRAVLTGAAAVALIGGVSLASGLRGWTREQIEDGFGPDVAREAERQGFIDDYLADLAQTRGPDYWRARLYFRAKPAFLSPIPDAERELREHLFSLFLRSTTAVAAQERGAEFHYGGLFQPHLAPCSNHLGALYADV